MKNLEFLKSSLESEFEYQKNQNELFISYEYFNRNYQLLKFQIFEKKLELLIENDLDFSIENKLYYFISHLRYLLNIEKENDFQFSEIEKIKYFRINKYFFLFRLFKSYEIESSYLMRYLESYEDYYKEEDNLFFDEIKEYIIYYKDESIEYLKEYFNSMNNYFFRRNLNRRYEKMMKLSSDIIYFLDRFKEDKNNSLNNLEFQIKEFIKLYELRFIESENNN